MDEIYKEERKRMKKKMKKGEGRGTKEKGGGLHYGKHEK